MMERQTSGVLRLHTSREGEVEVPCTGYVREVVLSNGDTAVVGDVLVTQQNSLLLEASIAALTEHMAKQLPARYKGGVYSSPPEEEERLKSTECRVRLVALAGKDVRFSSEGVEQ